MLINDIDGNFQTTLWLTIKKAAEKFDCNLIVFEGRGLMCALEVERQHHIVYEFAKKNRLDGVIITTSTITNLIPKSQFLKFTEKYKDIPVISLGGIVPGATSLLPDNKEGMKDLVRHLVTEHGYRRIIFVTGPEIHEDSIERYAAYREVLEENNIEFDESLVYHGDFLSTTGYKIMSDIQDKKVEYDAIVYANDDMALGAMQFFKDSIGIIENLSEGKPICGFDDSLNSALTQPALTTVRQPIYEMCNAAVDLLLKKIDGQEIDEVIKFGSVFVKRESCGCEYNTNSEMVNGLNMSLLPSYRVHENVQTYSLDELFARITNSMQRCFIRSCFISTYSDGSFIYDPISIFGDSLVFPEKSNMIYSYFNFHQVDILKETSSFYTRDIVPDTFLPSERRFTYLVNPLFFIKEHFGFVVFEVEHDDVINYEPLRGQISNTLKNALMLIERENMEKCIIETERLASLGQLIGGISHNLLSPIMSVSGNCNALDELVDEFINSIGNDDVVFEDYKEIAGEMTSRIDKIRNFMSYMTNVISTVRSQAVQLNSNTTSKFTLTELMEQIEFIKKNNESLKKFQIDIKVDTDEKTKISGDIGNLILIVRNLLINSTQAYNELDENKKIDVFIEKDKEMVLIKVKDYGCGISNSAKNKIFKTMFTTKGKNGSGLSLMLSYSTIKGKFNGEMWFDSELGKGSTFYIGIPCNLDKQS